MADANDLAALKAGEEDLVNADLREADLSGFDLSYRKLNQILFQKTNFEGAKLVRSNLQRSNFVQTRFRRANLDGVNASGTSFIRVAFDHAILKNANFSNCFLKECNFKNADLRNADFSSVNLTQESDFDDAIVDETTKFDGAQILRSMAHFDAFRYYELKQGTLVRKSQEEPVQTSTPINALGFSERAKLTGAIADAVQTLEKISKTKASGEHGQIGHNSPPEEYALDSDELDEASGALRAVTHQIASDSPDINTIRESEVRLLELGKKTASWLASKADIFTDAFVQEAGKSLGKPSTILGLWFILTGQFQLIVNLIAKLFS